MAKESDLALLNDPVNFPAAGADVNGLDLSGKPISFDFSGRRVFNFDFSNCVLNGSKFKSCFIMECNLSGSDWNGCDFEGATFNGGTLARIKNANKALNLFSVKIHGTATEFETAERSFWMWLDWERLGTVGKLPLFGVSATVLVAMPLYFYFLAHYNHSLTTLKNSINSSLPSAVASPLAAALGKLPPLPIPSLSLVTLISAFSLALGSSLYSFFGPSLPKQFSLAQWQYQQQQPTLPYLVQSWSKQVVRMTCAFFYLVGGGCGLFVLSVKLYQTARYIWLG
jgi:hypothetical protein